MVIEPVETLANLIGLTRVTIIPNMFLRIVPSRKRTACSVNTCLNWRLPDKPLFTLDERELKRSAPSLRKH
ncbi:hypothetical protein ACNKHV_03960 [Shigella flexneri]